MLCGSWLLISAGCGEAEREEKPAHAATSEQPWHEQVAAVRAGRSHKIIVEQQAISPVEWDELRSGCETLSVLEVSLSNLSDDALDVIADLPQLTRLKLGVPLGDAGMEQIAVAESLTVLNLPDARFTDAGLESAARLQNLELLRFHSPRVTDAGLVHVAGMNSLRFLHLIDVPVTDAGIVHLHEMTWLESFYLDGGNCTDEGLSELLQALPELHFHKDQLHLPGDRHAHPHD